MATAITRAAKVTKTTSAESVEDNDVENETSRTRRRKRGGSEGPGRIVPGASERCPLKERPDYCTVFPDPAGRERGGRHSDQEESFQEWRSAQKLC